MDAVYRLYTENTGRKAIADLVTQYFPGFTMLDATGYYNGKAERSLVIEIIAPVSRSHIIRYLGKRIAQYGKQECILIGKQELKKEYVSGD